MKLTAVIPVAGEGTRLRPHTYSQPKVLIEVAGKPMISHILDRLAGAGVKDVVFVVGHMGAAVREYVESAYDFRARFVEQRERKGLGHAIYLTRHEVSEGPMLIVLGDTLFRADLDRVLKSEISLIAVKETDDPRRFGIAEVREGRVVRLVEKPADPPSNLAVIGIYYMSDSKPLFDCLEHIVSNDMRTRGEYQLTDALALMVERGIPLEVFLVDGWYDCGKVETLLEANRSLLELEGRPVEREGSAVIPPVAIHAEAQIVNSVVGPYVSVGRGARVEDSVVKDSIISAGSKVSYALLEGAVVGRNCTVMGRARALNIGDSAEIVLA